MSSAATINFGFDQVTIDEWQAFARDNNITHSPHTVGGNVYYQRDHRGVDIVEVTVDDVDPSTTIYIRRITLSTYFMGEFMPDVINLTLAIWKRWGGSLRASDEIRDLILARLA